jgi:hypothetical protein
MTVKMTLCPQALGRTQRLALFLHPNDRHKYLQKVAELLYQGGEVRIGDGAVARAARIAEKQFFTRQDTGHKVE